MALYVVGSIAYDTIITPFERRERVPGGSATYISLAASLFCNDVKIISIVGYDFSGKEMEMFKARKINTDLVKVSKNYPTFYWAGRYNPDMNSRETILTEINCLKELEIPDKIKDKCEVLVLGNIDPELQKKTIDAFPEKPPLIFLDTITLWITTRRQQLEELLKYVNVVCINDEEARIWANHYSLRKASQYLLKDSVELVVIKKGEHGCMLVFKDNTIIFLPALPLEEIKDPTGAGDTFLGAAAGFLYDKKKPSQIDFIRAFSYGTIVASFCVEDFGPQALLNLSIDQINKRMLTLRSMTNIYVTYEQ